MTEYPRTAAGLRLRRHKDLAALLALALLVFGVVQVSARKALPALGWPDEWIYLTLARNIAEKGSLNTKFYLASSIEAIGYPRRDVRALMPMAPLFLIGLCGINTGRVRAGIFVTALLSLSLFLDSWQIAFFNRYKGVNLEDQDRAATFIERRTKRFAPRRVVGGRYFQYGFRNFPVEVVWSGADDIGSLDRLYAKFPFDFVVIHRRSPMRFDLRKDPRYEWINAAEGQGAEYQIYRMVGRE